MGGRDRPADEDMKRACDYWIDFFKDVERKAQLAGAR
jgi:hypothetical protein